MKLLVPALILKGSHFYLHPNGQRPQRIAHIIHWNREDQAEVPSVCNKTAFQFVAWSPRHSMPNFVDTYSREPQIASSILRYQIALDNLCPDCFRYLQRLHASGMLIADDSVPLVTNPTLFRQRAK